jgi:hypothetical protein
MRKYHRCGNQMNLEVLEGISRWYEQYNCCDKPRCEYKVI